MEFGIGGCARDHDSSTHTEDASPQPVDMKHLRRYTLGDRDLEREVLGLFLEQTPKTIAELQFAADDRAWCRAAHSLKGSARAVGAWRVARMGEQAERLGGISDRAACERLLERITDATAEAAAFVAGMTRAS